MRFKGNAQAYGSVAIALHWVTAVAVLVLLALGFCAANTGDGTQQAAILRFHAPLGILVLILTAARVVWWFFDVRPEIPAGYKSAAQAVHLGLYVLLLVMGASGVGLMILSNAAPVLFFHAAGPLPRFADFVPMRAHTVGAIALLALLCGHTGAALHHQFFKRDHLLARMGIGAR